IEGLAKVSGVVVTGTIIDTRSFETADQVLTRYRVRITDVVRAQPPIAVASVISVLVPGGDIEGRSQMNGKVPTVRRGIDVLLLLMQDPIVGEYRLSFGHVGVYGVEDGRLTSYGPSRVYPDARGVPITTMVERLRAALK